MRDTQQVLNKLRLLGPGVWGLVFEVLCDKTHLNPEHALWELEGTLFKARMKTFYVDP